MKENATGLKCNLWKVVSHVIGPNGYADITELSESFLPKGSYTVMASQ
jgi:hypothetical protein